MSDTNPRKTQLRKNLRRRRSELSPAQQLAASRALTNSIIKLPTWTNAQCIALYLAADGEIDTRPLEELARSIGKQLFLPIISDDDLLSFARWNADDSLLNNRYNIPEPITGGLLVAVVLAIVEQIWGLSAVFDSTLKPILMLAFFAAVGLSADLSMLGKGGKRMLWWRRWSPVARPASVSGLSGWRSALPWSEGCQSS